MNKKLLIFFSILLCSLTFCLFGCNRSKDPENPGNTQTNQSATAYGIVHKAYVGKATVNVEGKKVKSVSYDEAFLPHTWANIKYELKDGETLASDVLEHVKGDEKMYYAKYISIDGKLFTGSVRETDLTLDDKAYSAQVIKYTSKDIPDLFVYLYNSDANCEWYFNAAKNKKIFICDAEGKKLETYPSNNEYGWFKSEGKYWNDKDSYPLGWKGNLEQLADYLMGKELTELDESKFVKDETGVEENGYTYNYWTINGVKTKVTMVDVYDYYKIAQKAYAKAIKNVK